MAKFTREEMTNILAKKTRYEFTWLNLKNNHEITDWVVATDGYDAVAKFIAQRKAANKDVPAVYTIENTFLV